VRQPTRVMIVANHPIMSDGLRLVFQREPDMEVVCEARDLEPALRDFESSCPDLVVVDLQLPEGEGLRAVRALRKLSPSLPMVVLTMYPEQAVVIKCRGVYEVSGTASSLAIIAMVRAAALANKD
jgi:two-component system, NarL family, response regulator DevR